ncbi:hypothetical protein SDC9_70657 [bioreactor metagenome]|uniref:Uncharacterized protein n=1 Tax=bioreactor metagenome TaxID=1076179 RepID=A0A644Y6J5_9ZZZZ
MRNSVQLQRLDRKRILLVRFFHDVNLAPHLFELDFGFGVFGDHIVEVAVEQSDHLRKTGRVAVGIAVFPGVFGPGKLFAAILPVLAPGLPEFLLRRPLGIEVFPLHLAGIGNQAAKGSRDVVQIADFIGLQAADIDVDRRPAGAGQTDQREVFRIAGEFPVMSVEGGVDRRISVAEEHHRLVDRVRSGVEQVAGELILPGLPVPAPPKPAPIGTDVDDIAQHARRQNFAHLGEERVEARILKRINPDIVLFGFVDDLVEKRHRRRARLFGDDVLGALHRRQRRLDVETARRRIDEKIEFGPLGEQFLIIVERLAAEFGHRLFAAFRKFVGDGHNFEVRIVPQIVGVDAVSAAALSGNRDSDDWIHVGFISWFGVWDAKKLFKILFRAGIRFRHCSGGEKSECAVRPEFRRPAATAVR